MRRLASSSVAWRKACMRPPLGRRIQGPNSISACQIWLLNSASNFLCAWGASSCRSERPRCLRKRYSVEGEMAGALRQRIAVQYHLEGLSREELDTYLAHQLKAAGAPQPPSDATARPAL